MFVLLRCLMALAHVVTVLACAPSYAVNDRELDNVYKDRLVIPPELRTPSPQDGGGADSESKRELKPTPAEEDFMSMFEVG